MLIKIQPGCREWHVKIKAGLAEYFAEKVNSSAALTVQEIKDTWSVVIWNLAGRATVWPRSILHVYTQWSLFFKMAKTYPLQEAFIIGSLDELCTFSQPTSRVLKGWITGIFKSNLLTFLMKHFRCHIVSFLDNLIISGVSKYLFPPVFSSHFLGWYFWWL